MTQGPHTKLFIGVADVLIIEDRTCKCGVRKRIPSPRISRLLIPPRGGLRHEYVCRPRGKDDPAVQLRITRIVPTAVDNCEECWTSNTAWEVALLMELDPPPLSFAEQLWPEEEPTPEKSRHPFRTRKAVIPLKDEEL